MKPPRLVRSISIIGMAALLLMKAASAADIHVMISSGFHGAYSELGPAFERATGNHLITTRGPSMGDSPEAIPTRLSRGESADVVILDGGAADELGKRGLVQADSKVELARSLIGMVVREGADKPDIGSVAAFRNTLLSAKSIAYSDSASGVYVSTEMFEKLGIADAMKDKAKKIPATPVAEIVAKGEAEIGMQQISELKPVPGIDIVGPLPDALQKVTVFSAGVASASKRPDAARALIQFLASPAAIPAITKSGLDPVVHAEPAIPAR